MEFAVKSPPAPVVTKIFASPPMWPPSLLRTAKVSAPVVEILFALALIAANEPIVPPLLLSIVKFASLALVRLPEKSKLILALSLMLPPPLLLIDALKGPGAVSVVAKLAAVTMIAAFEPMVPPPLPMNCESSRAVIPPTTTRLIIAFPPMVPPSSPAFLPL